MNTRELHHLLAGPNPGERAEEDNIVLFKVQCLNNAGYVLQRCKEVLEAVLRQGTEIWPSDHEWYKVLPEWFIECCAPETTQEEEEQIMKLWRNLSFEEQARLSEEEKWSVSDWIYWFRPEERQWFWWDAFLNDSNSFYVEVSVNGYPFPWGSLEWLVRASGAISIQPEKCEAGNRMRS